MKTAFKVDDREKCPRCNVLPWSRPGYIHYRNHSLGKCGLCDTTGFISPEVARAIDAQLELFKENMVRSRKII